MTGPLPDYKRRALEERRKALLADYKAANNQSTQTLNAADRTKIERQIADLEQEIREIDRQLGADQTPAGQGEEHPESVEKAKPPAEPPSTVLPPPEPAPEPAPKSGIRGWFSRLPDAGKVAIITGIFAVIVALIPVVASLIRSPDGPTPTPTPMSYVVRVEGQNSPGTGIKDAKVTLEVPGRPPLDAYTDGNGVATIIVPAQYVGGSAVIIVEAPGFATFRQNIRVDAGALPPLVRLSP